MKNRLQNKARIVTPVVINPGIFSEWPSTSIFANLRGHTDRIGGPN
jgi:hypothetical protein